jgi:hypothetical protein
MYIAATILSILLVFMAILGQDLSLGVHARGVVRRGPNLVLKGDSGGRARDYADPKLRTQALTAVALFLVSATAAVILALTMSPN